MVIHCRTISVLCEVADNPKAPLWTLSSKDLHRLQGPASVGFKAWVSLKDQVPHGHQTPPWGHLQYEPKSWKPSHV